MSKTTRVSVLAIILCLLVVGLVACSSGSAKITGIQLSEGYRNVYIVGEDLDVAGMELIVENSDGTTSTVKVADVRSEIKFLNVNTDSVAQQIEVTIEYKKQKTTFFINVVQRDSDENKVNVIFDTNDLSVEAKDRIFEERKVPQLSKLEAPASSPSRKNFAFDGWYKDTALKNPWNFSVDQVVLTSDNDSKTIYIYAKWTPYCTVKFIKVSPDGKTETEVAKRLVKKGDSLTDFPNIPLDKGEEKYIYEWDYSSFGSITQDVTVRTKQPPVLKTYDIEFCDTINGVSQVLYSLIDVPYGTDLLDPDTILTTGESAIIHTLQEITSLSPANKEHYVFTDSWQYKGSEYSVTDPGSGNPLRSVKQSMQLYAHYSIEMFTATFDLNYQDQVVAPPDPQTVAYNTPIVNVTVTRQGYDFDGWFKDAACTRPWNFNTEKLVGDRTLFAKWTKLFSIDFYGLYYGDTTIAGKIIPALDDNSLEVYQNSGGIWKDAAGNEVYGSHLVGQMLTDTVAGYKYNHIFDGNNVVYTRKFFGSVSVRQGETTTALPSGSLVELTGYTARWSSTSFNAIQSDRSVYAIYTIRKYNVRFIDGDKDIIAKQVVPYEGDAVAPDDPSVENIPNKTLFDNYLTVDRKGYIFNGWSSTAYKNVTEDVTISATFTPKTYRVTIQIYPGVTNYLYPSYDSTLPLNTPVRDGYDFDGWFTTPDYAAGSQWLETDRVTGAISLYAKWVEIYTITFTDGAPLPDTLVLATRKVRKGGTLTDIPAVPEIIGKNGVWREDSAVPNFSNITRHMTISAVYTDKTFDVIFRNGNADYYYLGKVLYGSTVTAPRSPEDPSQSAPDPNAVYVGYKFEGWAVGGVSGYVDFGTYQIKQNTTFIASYSRRTFTVKFVDSDYDSTGYVIREVEVEYEAEAYPPAAPVKVGKNWIGWSSDKNATLPQPNDYKSIKQNTVVYALYRIKVYKVSFKSIEDNTTWATIDVAHDNLAAYPSDKPLPTYTGYNFTGWDYNFNTPITSNKTIYARFAINVYTVTFNSRGGSQVAPASANHNTYVNPPADPYYENMAFLGWYIDDTCNIQYLFNEPLMSNLTLYAKWSEYISGFGDIVYTLNSEQNGYTVTSASSDALAIKIDNFFGNKPVVSIGSDAFRGNTRLQYIMLPNTLQTIGANAFEGCINLRSIDIPQRVVSIGDNAFNGCRRLTSVGFDPNPFITTIGNNAFINASSLVNFQIPGTVTTIGTGAFLGCSSLQELDIPRSVTAIGASAFENCSGLKFIRFAKSSPCVLGTGAFQGTTRSFRIYVPDVLAYSSGSSTAWQESASRLCPSSQIVSDWYYEIIKVGAHANSLKLLHYLGKDTVLRVPQTLTVAGVVRTVYSLGDYLFDGKVTAFITNSDMPLSAETFGAAANLARLEVSIVDSEGNQRELLNSNINYMRIAFETINSLKELSISATDTLKNLFGNVNPPANLKKVNVLGDRTVLPANMFYNCLSIEEVTIPASITTIGASAFYGCYNLKNVTIAPGSGLTNIGGSAFENCISLANIAIPSSVNAIDSNAFKGTPFVEDSEEEFVVLGDGILYAYNGNDETVILPKEIKQINEYAFYRASLRSFMFEDGSRLKSVGQYAFAECVNLEHAAFPESTDTIEDGVFYNDIKLSKVILFFNSLAGSRIYIANTTKLFVNTMQSLEIYITTTSKDKYLEPDNHWLNIVRTQLGNPSWQGIRDFNLFYGDDWIFDSTSNGLMLIQYFGSDKNITVPSKLNVDGTESNVIRLGNFIFPRNTVTLDFSVDVVADAKVFGGLSFLTEVTMRDVASNTIKIDNLYLYNMLSANKSLSTINIGGKMSIKSMLGGLLPPANVTTVNIFNGETVLEKGMFEDCSYIVNINLPSSLTTVGERAFLNSGWEAAYNGDFVTILRDLDGRGLLVSYKGNQKHVVIPSDVKAINRKLFENNTFVEIVSASDLVFIYDGAFKDAKALSKVILGGEAPGFGTDVFQSLIPGAQLFVDADKTADYSPAEIAGINVVANNIIVSGDYMLQSLGGGNARLVHYKGEGKSVAVPESVGGYTITDIGNNVFYSDVENLTFRASDTINEFSFGNLKLLTSITILDTHNIVCDRAYIYDLLEANPGVSRLAYNGGDCTLYYLLNNNSPTASVKTVEVIPGSVSIINSMLDQCPGITNIVLPSSVKTVGLFAFEKTDWFAAQPTFVIILDGYLYKYKGFETNVTIPNNVVTIGQKAFAQTANGIDWTGNVFIKSVKFQFGSAAKAILFHAFYNCTLLSKIDVPSTLTNIDQYAFFGTNISVENNTLIARGDRGDVLVKYYGTAAVYELPNEINTINAYAFADNESITSLIIPTTGLLVMIGEGAFQNCVNLGSVKINNNGTNNDVKSVLELEYIEDIGANAFAGTPWFTALGKYLFGNNALLLAKGEGDTLVLSDSDKPAGFDLNFISHNAFASTTANKLFVEMTSPLTLRTGAFDPLTAIYVPSDMFDMYAAQWNSYIDKLESVEVSEGSFVDEDGALIYVNKTQSIIALTDNSGITSISSNAFAGAVAGTLMLTVSVPPVMGGNWLTGIGSIYVPQYAVTAYKSAWSYYKDKIYGYDVVDGFFVFNSTLYRYSGNGSKVYLPAGISRIAGYAFAGVSNIEYLYVPSDVVTVDYKAYAGLENAVIGTQAASIGGWDSRFAERVLAVHTSVDESNVFGDFIYKLTPEGATIIRYLGSAATLTLPADIYGYTLFGIATNAFSGRTNLIRIRIPTSIVNVGITAFQYCASLTVIVNSDSIPAGYLSGWNLGVAETYVNGGTIYEDSYQNKFILNNNKAILIEAASGHPSMTLSMAQGNLVSGIAANAFAECVGLNKLRIPSTVATLGRLALAGCGNTVIYFDAVQAPAATGWAAHVLDYYTDFGKLFNYNDGSPAGTGYSMLITNNAATIINYTGTSSAITIPQTVLYSSTYYYVTAIAPYAFYGKTNITSVTLNNAMQKIGAYAFSGCTSLAAFNFNASLTNIGKYAFAGNAWTRSASDWIVVQNKGYLYTGSGSVTVVPHNIVSLISGAFAMRTARYAVFTSDTPISISINALSGIDTVLVPQAYLSLYREAWAAYAGIIDSFIEVDGAYYYRGQLLYYSGTAEELAVPASVGGYPITAIADGAFAGSDTLQKLVLPATLDTVGEGVFAGCSNLIIYLYGDDVFADGWSDGASHVYKGIEGSVIVYNGIQYFIEDGFATVIGFDESAKVLTVEATISDSKYTVTKIAHRAFAGDKLYRLTLPSTITVIEESAFGDASKLVLTVSDAALPDNTNGWDAGIREIYKGSSQFVTEGDFTVHTEGSVTTLYAYTGTSSDVQIPDQVGGKTITGISGYAFFGKTLTSIICNTAMVAERISDNAFVGSIGDCVVYYRGNIDLSVYGWAATAYEVHANYNVYIYGDYRVIPTGIGEETGLIIIGYSLTPSTELVIPKELHPAIGTLPVRGIASYAFGSFDADVRRIVLPESVLYIGKRAFEGAAVCVAANAYVEGTAKPGFTVGWNSYFSDTLYNAGNTVTVNDVVYIKNGSGAAVIGYNGPSSVAVIEESVIINGASCDVTKIVSYAFAEQTHLTRIYIPASVINIRDRIAFGNTNVIMSLAHSMVASGWPAGWNDNGNQEVRLSSVLFQKDNLSLLLENGEISVIGYRGASPTVVIPDSATINELSYSVTAVEPYAFYNREDIYRIYIPAAIDKIGAYAFAGCTNAILFVGDASADAAWDYDVGAITIAFDADAKHTYYDYGAFIQRDGLRYQVSGNSALLIDYNGSATEVTIPESFIISEVGYEVKAIGTYAFAFLTDIRSIIVPNTVNMVHQDAFLGTYNAVINLMHEFMPVFQNGWAGDTLRVNIDAGKVFTAFGFNYLLSGDPDIGEGEAAVLGTTQIGASVLSIPAVVSYLGKEYKVTRIADYAFYNMTSLNSVTFPSAGSFITEIGAYAFYDCVNLLTVNNFGSGITNIGEKAFTSTLWFQNRVSQRYVKSGEKLRLYTGNETAVVFSNTNNMDILGGAFGSGRIVRFAVFLDGITPTVHADAFAGLQKVLVPAAMLNMYKALWSDAADMIDAFVEVDGMLLYRNELLAIVFATGELAVPAEAGGYTIDTIASNVDKIKNNTLTGLTVPATVKTIGANSFPYTVIYYEVEAKPAGYSDSITALTEYYNYTEFFEVDGTRFVKSGNRLTLVRYIGSAAEYSIPVSVLYQGAAYAVNAIGAYAFVGTNLKSVYLPAGIAAVNAYAFRTAYEAPAFILYTALVKAAYPWYSNWEMPVYFNVSTVHSQGSLRFIVINGEIAITGYFGLAQSIVIPQSISVNQAAINVTTIGGYAFAGSTNLATVSIPQSVRYIGKNAFAGTNWLAGAANFIVDNGRLLLYNGIDKKVIIQEDLGIRSIVGGAFLSSGAQRVTILGDTPMIELYDGAFDGIDIIDVPDIALDIYKDYIWTAYSPKIIGSIIKVGDLGFVIGADGKAKATRYYGYLPYVTIPDSITLGDKSYTVTALGDGLFQGVMHLIKITVPDTVKTLGEGVFEGCFNTVVYLEHEVITGWQDGWDKDLLGVYYNINDSFVITDGFTVRLDESARKLTVIEYNGGASNIDLSLPTVYGGTVYNVAAIGWYAFYNKTFITSVILPDTLVKINKYAFAGTGWASNGETKKVVGGKLMLYTGQETTFTIGESDGIDAICGGAFASSAVTVLDIAASGEIILDDGALTGILSITVAAEAVDFYKAAWPQYADIISARQ